MEAVIKGMQPQQMNQQYDIGAIQYMIFRTAKSSLSYLGEPTKKALMIVTAIVRAYLMQSFESPPIQLAGERSELRLTKVFWN
jgi:hypothetical protein